MALYPKLRFSGLTGLRRYSLSERVYAVIHISERRSYRELPNQLDKDFKVTGMTRD